MAVAQVGPWRGVDAVAVGLGEREELLHEIDAGDALWEGVAEQARGPDDGLPVGAYEVAPFDDGAQLGLVAQRDELGGVDVRCPSGRRCASR